MFTIKQSDMNEIRKIIDSSLKNINRKQIDAAIKMLGVIVHSAEFSSSVDEPSFQLITKCINKLQARENRSLLKSYLPSSKEKHLENIQALSDLKDKMNITHVAVVAKNAHQTTNARFLEQERSMKKKIEELENQSRTIQIALMQNFIRLEEALGDLRFYTMVKDRLPDKAASNKEIEALREEIILSSAKDHVNSHITLVQIHCVRVLENIEGLRGIPVYDAFCRSLDLGQEIAALAKITQETKEQLDKYVVDLQDPKITMKQVEAISKKINVLQQSLEKATKPTIEKIKRNIAEYTKSEAEFGRTIPPKSSHITVENEIVHNPQERLERLSAATFAEKSAKITSRVDALSTLDPSRKPKDKSLLLSRRHSVPNIASTSMHGKDLANKERPKT